MAGIQSLNSHFDIEKWIPSGKLLNHRIRGYTVSRIAESMARLTAKSASSNDTATICRYMDFLDAKIGTESAIKVAIYVVIICGKLPPMHATFRKKMNKMIND